VPARVLADQDNEAQVGSLVAGRVCKVFVKVGDYVKAGEELMRVEGMEIGEIKAKYLSAKANLSFQEKNFERQKKLLEENIGSQKSYLESQSEYEKAAAEFGAERNRIGAIGLSDREIINEKDGHDEDRCRGPATLAIKSPISGLIVERNVVIGQRIDNATNAFRIIDLKSVWVDGQMYEKDIEKVTRGSPVVFQSPALGEAFSGTLSYVGQVIDEKTRTMTVRAEFANANGNLKPNMFGELRITAGKKSTAILIPAEALVKMENTDFVFIKKEEFTFEKRPVQTGAAQNDMVAIEKGVKEGERIVTKGAFYLKAELLKGTLGEGE
jgi:cobalt-zinc-cadmium efflux system membrane fusion protein